MFDEPEKCETLQQRSECSVTGLIITALRFPIAGCIAGRRPLAECFLSGVGIVGGLLFVSSLLHVPLVLTIALISVAGLLGYLVIRPPGKAATQQHSNPFATTAIIIALL